MMAGSRLLTHSDFASPALYGSLPSINDAHTYHLLESGLLRQPQPVLHSPRMYHIGKFTFSRADVINYLQQGGKFLRDGTDLAAVFVFPVSIGQMYSLVVMGYPSVYLASYAIVDTTSLILFCTTKAVLEMIHKLKLKTPSGRRVEHLNYILDSVADCADTFYFTLPAVISLYAAIYSALYHIGEADINVTDELAWFGFILPCLSVGALHTTAKLLDKYLDEDVKILEEDNIPLKKRVRARIKQAVPKVLKAVEGITAAGTINFMVVTAFQKFCLEVNNTNRLRELSVYVGSGLGSLGLMLLKYLVPVTQPWVDRGLIYPSAAVYGYSLVANYSNGPDCSAPANMTNPLNMTVPVNQTEPEGLSQEATNALTGLNWAWLMLLLATAYVYTGIRQYQLPAESPHSSDDEKSGLLSHSEVDFNGDILNDVMRHSGDSGSIVVEDSSESSESPFVPGLVEHEASASPVLKKLERSKSFDHLLIQFSHFSQSPESTLKRSHSASSIVALSGNKL